MAHVESRIEAVKIYQSGATVFRVLELVPEGASPPDEIEIPGLPLALHDATVRVRLRARSPEATDVVVSDVRVGLHALRTGEIPPAPERGALQEAERELERRRRQLADVEGELDLLAQIRVPDRPAGEEGKPPPASPMAARVALEQFTDEAIRERIVEARRLREEVKALSERVAELSDQLARASDAGHAHPHDLRKCVVARLRHRGAPLERATLVLEYFVPGARWAPAYQCRLSRDGTKAELQLRALLCQRTGEDWRGVKLTLSTAKPLSWTELPALSAIRIGRAQATPPPRPGFRPPPRGAQALFADYDRSRGQATQALPPLSGFTAPELYVEPLSLPSPAPLPTASRPPPPGSARSPGARMKRSASRAREETAELAADLEMDAFEEAAPKEALFMASAAMPPPPPMAPAPLGAARAHRASAPLPDETSLESIVFTQLRLPGPDEPDRSRLRPVDSRGAYLEVLAKSGLEVGFDVMSVVASAADEAERAAHAALPDGATDVARASGSFDFAYGADATVDVPSDGAFHSVALGTRTAEAELRYVVVPREDPHVYRVAMLKNPSKAPLLPGPAEVYVGGEYVLTTTLPTVAPQGELRLGLGVEQAIKVARNARFSEARSGEKVVAMSELVHDVEIDVVNHLGREIRCEVRERVPQPAPGAEVVVEEGPVRPAWEIYEQEERGVAITGGRRWHVTVGPGEERRLSARYTVKIYANNELVGGNRREA